MNEIFVQVRIKEQTEVGEFNDAIYFPLEEYQKIDQTQIDNLVSERINNHIDRIQNPPVTEIPEPTKEELENTKLELLNYKNSLEQQLQEIQTKIDFKEASIDPIEVDVIK